MTFQLLIIKSGKTWSGAGSPLCWRDNLYRPRWLSIWRWRDELSPLSLVRASVRGTHREPQWFSRCRSELLDLLLLFHVFFSRSYLCFYLWGGPILTRAICLCGGKKMIPTRCVRVFVRGFPLGCVQLKGFWLYLPSWLFLLFRVCC